MTISCSTVRISAVLMLYMKQLSLLFLFQDIIIPIWTLAYSLSSLALSKASQLRMMNITVHPPTVQMQLTPLSICRRCSDSAKINHIHVCISCLILGLFNRFLLSWRFFLCNKPSHAFCSSISGFLIPFLSPLESID